MSSSGWFQVRLEGASRTIFLYPLSISFIVTGLTWQWVLSRTIGFHDEVGVKLVEHLAGIGERRKALIELHRALERLSDGFQHPISNLHSYTACSGFDGDPHARSAPALHDPDPAVTKYRDHAFERPAERFGRSGKAWYPGRFAG
jgi:hypothetical protein